MKGLSYKEKLELAEWIAVNNGAAITGSLMLKRRGIDLGREPEDIDIIVRDIIEEDDLILPPFIEKREESEEEKDGYTVLARVWYKGVKIEFIEDSISWKHATCDMNYFNHHGLAARYCTIKDLVKAKESYIEEDKCQEYIEKSRKDLEVIKKFQLQFPIVRYMVELNGVLFKMTSYGKIGDNYIFKPYSMLACKAYDEWSLKKDKEEKHELWVQHLSLDSPNLIESYDKAIALSKERWDKVMKPNALYRVVRYFDDCFDGYESEPISKREATDLAYKLQKKNHKIYTSYNIKVVEE